MIYTLKAILIDNLKKLENFLVEPPILIPKPKIVKLKEEEKSNAYIFSPECTFHVLRVENKNILLKDLNDFLYTISQIKITEGGENPSFKALLDKKSEWSLLDVNKEEGYNLEIVNNQILIYSPYEKGIFYGVQTLIQLLKNVFLINRNPLAASKATGDKLILPEIEIKDAPDLMIRGVTNDISRGQVFSVEGAKRYIKILSHYKMNFFCAYIEDMFAHPKHPKIGKDRGALTKEEIKEIALFAKERYIEFVPIFECLGHVDNILIHKEYEDLGEFPGAQCFNCSDPKVFAFLNDNISELSKVFPNNYFHMGCDESFDFGKGRSKEIVQNEGISNTLTNFYENIYKIALENKFKLVIMYDDIVRKDKHVLKSLNKDIFLMYWDYAPKKKFPTLKKLLNAGFHVIVSPSMLNWQRNFPDNVNSSKNIANLVKEAYNNRNRGCLGVLTSTWGDERYYSLRENEIFGAVLTGNQSWNCTEFAFDAFSAKYGFLFYGIGKDQIQQFVKLFSNLSSMPSTYLKAKALVLVPPLFYTYFFKHPFASKEFVNSFKNYEELGSLASECLEIYNSIQSSVLFEKENFEYLQFGAELAKCLKDKIDVSIRVSNLTSNQETLPQDIERAVEDLKKIREQIRVLMVKYDLLWMRSAKRPCLDQNKKLFEFLIKCYEDKITQLSQKTLFVDPYLPSEWIWVHEKSCPPSPRYFRTTFELNKPVKKAVIQGIASNYMKISLNGEPVGEVLSRFSLSVLPIHFRVRTFDITKLLKQGKNVLNIEAYNYDGYKGAINLYGQILFKDDSVEELKTDCSWKCFKKEKLPTNEWMDVTFSTELWKGTKSYGCPPSLNGDIFKPNLLAGEVSSTQDYFGIESYFYNMLFTFMGKFVATVLVKPFLSKVIKSLRFYG